MPPSSAMTAPAMQPMDQREFNAAFDRILDGRVEQAYREFMTTPRVQQAIQQIRMGDPGDTLQQLVRTAFTAGGDTVIELVGEMISYPAPGEAQQAKIEGGADDEAGHDRPSIGECRHLESGGGQGR